MPKSNKSNADLVARYQTAIAQAEQARRAADRLAGRLQECQRRLKTEFECNNQAAGQKLLAALQAESTEIEATLNQLLVDFESEYGEALDGDES